MTIQLVFLTNIEQEKDYVRSLKLWKAEAFPLMTCNWQKVLRGHALLAPDYQLIDAVVQHQLEYLLGDQDASQYTQTSCSDLLAGTEQSKLNAEGEREGGKGKGIGGEHRESWKRGT